jgi:hypothetical protein
VGLQSRRRIREPWRHVGRAPIVVGALIAVGALVAASCGGGDDDGSGTGAPAEASAAGSGDRQPSEGHGQHHGAGDDHASPTTSPGGRPRPPGPVAHAGCPESGHGPRPEAPPVTPARLSDESRAALRALALESEPLPCGAVAAWVDHVRGHAHGVAPPERSLTGPDGDAFAGQWAAAVSAAVELATPQQATAAGYAQASSQVPEVGTHWIKWTLVDAPFDPARPSMLLFDQRPDRPARLVGFSYWVRSPTAPEGFAGGNDAWHSHLGLCFVQGRLYLEGVAARLACPGTWLNGSDLWMLHAWVVPDLPNPEGRFAPANPAL